MSSIELPAASWEEAKRRVMFFNDNYPRLLKQYPEQYVAVSPATGEVIASNADLVILIDELRERGFQSPRDVAIELISDRFQSMIL